jgi:phage terminase large subunit-like protein
VDLQAIEQLWNRGPAARRAAPVASVAHAAAAALAPSGPRAWRKTARPEQLQVADARSLYVLLLAGRGSGKTWCASNTLVEWALAEPGYYAIVAPTFSDCRALCVEGPSGVLRALGSPNGEPGGDLLRYDKSKFEIHLTNGSTFIMASDEAPARLRGPNFSGSWCDEIGSYKRIRETWEEGVLFSTRIGSARKLLTGTPKRGNRLVKEFHDRGTRGDPDVLLVRGRTLDNAANLSEDFLRTIRAKYEGTTLGKQELEGVLLADAEGAIVTTALIDATRCQWDDVPEFDRVMVGVDPAVTSRETSDHTGLVTVAIGGPPKPTYLGEPARVAGPHLYVLADDSVRATPESWARRVLKVAEMWAADAVTAEQNNGGDLVTTMIRMVAAANSLALPRLIPVWASVGKRTRAEPVAGVWEQRRVHIVGGLPDLEDQWAGWSPGDSDSPDQMDACCWAAVALMPELAIKAPTTVRVLASG